MWSAPNKTEQDLCTILPVLQVFALLGGQSEFRNPREHLPLQTVSQSALHELLFDPQCSDYIDITRKDEMNSELDWILTKVNQSLIHLRSHTRA